MSNTNHYGIKKYMHDETTDCTDETIDISSLDDGDECVEDASVGAAGPVDAPEQPVRKWKNRNSPVIGSNGVHTSTGDNARYARILGELISWGPVDKSDVHALEARFVKFLDFCAQNDVRITNAVTYLALGITKNDVYNWEKERSRTPAHCDFIRKIKHFCASYREMLGADGKLNPVTLIWWQKNYDGMVDKQELVLSPKDPLGELQDGKALAERIGATVVDE